MAEQPDNDPKLLANLGTDSLDIDEGLVDMERFGVYDAGDGVILLYAALRENDSAFWKSFRQHIMNLSVGMEGRGRRDAIHGESVHRGAPANIQAEIKKPDSWVQRHLTNRDWKKKEYERLGMNESETQ